MMAVTSAGVDLYREQEEVEVLCVNHVHGRL